MPKFLPGGEPADGGDRVTHGLLPHTHTHTPSAALCRPSPSPTCLFLKTNLPLISLAGAHSDNHSLNLRCWMAVFFFSLCFFHPASGHFSRRACLQSEQKHIIGGITVTCVDSDLQGHFESQGGGGGGEKRRQDVGTRLSSCLQDLTAPLSF